MKYYACVRRDDFTYELPEELIAQTPLPERSASRLLVLDARSGAVFDRTMKDFPGLLEPGDLLVFNDTRVIAARLTGTKPSGGRVEIFLERTLDNRRALVQLRASKPIREGLQIATDGGVVCVLEREDDLGWWNSRRCPGILRALGECTVAAVYSPGSGLDGSRALSEHLCEGERRSGRAYRQPALRCGAGGGSRGEGRWPRVCHLARGGRDVSAAADRRPRVTVDATPSARR